MAGSDPRLFPASVAAQFGQAVTLHQRGLLAEAEHLYRTILVSDPRHFDALQLLGVIALQRGQFGESIGLIGEALEINPTNAPAHYNLGLALLGAKRPVDALASFEKAIALRPAYAEAWANRGSALRELKRWDDALVSYDRALALNPNYVEALNNRALLLLDIGWPEAALLSADRAIALAPDNADAFNNRANALRELRRMDEALIAFDRALAAKPDHANAHLNAAMCRLAAGDFVRGWSEYEWRWRCAPLNTVQRDLSIPQWSGAEDLAGKTVHLYAEQGFGDTIQFCRYVPLVAARGARVILEIQDLLRPLLESVAGATQIIAGGGAVPPCDFHAPLMSLPHAFGTTVQTIPADVPYLSVPRERIEAWEKRLGEKTKPRIGMVWSGSSTFKNDLSRSIPVSRLLQVATDTAATVVSLQKDLRSGDREWLAAHPDVLHFGDLLQDFADTAALAGLMDIVISVDTSVAHLAGALGKPVWILLPFHGLDWRWMLNRDDSPWYPSARLYRQPSAGDWDSVIARVAADLHGVI